MAVCAYKTYASAHGMNFYTKMFNLTMARYAHVRCMSLPIYSPCIFMVSNRSAKNNITQYVPINLENTLKI